MINDNIKATGFVQFTLRDEFGSIKQQEKANLVVNTGKNFLASAVLNSSTSPFTYMAIGTGTNGAAATDTALQSELVRQVFTTSNVTNNVVTVSTTYAAGTGTGALTEAGILNNVSGGTLLSRVVYSVINKGALDTLTITWTITIS